MGTHRYTFIQADARQIPLADKSVQCVVTSPPYFGLRDYGVIGQIGLEKTYQDYLAQMVAVFREIRRVLRDDGTVWLNIGDSYAGHNLPGFRPGNEDKNGGASNKNGVGYVAGLKPKDLIGIPWRLAFALQNDGWYLRQDIIWAKPNPMPESVRDRCTKAHEYVFLLTKKERYYYDAEAVKVKASGRERWFGDRGYSAASGRNDGSRTDALDGYATSNRRSVWTISTEPCKQAHFATYPSKLVEICVKAGTSERGCCPSCGAGWKRVVEKCRVATRPGADTKIQVPSGWGIGKDARNSIDFAQGERRAPVYRDTIEIGNRDPQRHISQTVSETWLPGCKCPVADPIPCIVFDPFSGAGTTALTAARLGRFGIGTELKREYIDIALGRAEKFLAMKVRTKRAKRTCDTMPLFPMAG